MEVSVELVRQHCTRYFQSFAACVDRFPYTWHLDCEKQTVKLNKCAEGHPTIMKIKHGCLTEYERYEECAVKNLTDHEACLQPLSDFKKCAQQFYTPEDLNSVTTKNSKL